ncbi:PREDICTED: uncharacterized protein C6orf1 homolog isoform X2 [Chinchilla lanigera]|uniref:uncharacterized protein C6orf1 homolog isoform X2 n=1 Tax=Chinchilla lanigera TaxID=34839 RepID=UPI0006972286|nr:PREDICTED: uncharacterized protein C6orf1 homolog isoform X2 [Chinchilla lanigera]
MSNTTVPSAPRADSDSMVMYVQKKKRLCPREEPLSVPTCSPGWTGCAITCSPCTATTRLRSCTRRSRSSCPTWEIPRWCTAGRVVTNTSGCPCWTSRRDLGPDLQSKGPATCPLPLH